MLSEEQVKGIGEVRVSFDPFLMMRAGLCWSSCGYEAMHVFEDGALAAILLDDPGILEDDIEVIMEVLAFGPMGNWFAIIVCLHSSKQVFFFKINFITINYGLQDLF